MPRPIRATLLAFLFASNASFGHDTQSLKTIAELPVTKIAENVYLISAPLEGPNKQNEGFIANTGFIVTSEGVVVVDPGSSVQIGRELLKKIRSVTPSPVVAVFNTHVHGDHWLGNHAIAESYPNVAIYAHPRTIERIESGDGDQWITTMNQATEGATEGTKVVPPNRPVSQGDEIAVGKTNFNIHFQGKAHSDTDIMIEVVGDETIFLGDIVMVGRISSQPQDGDILGQIGAIDYALDTSARHFIPGHGRVGDGTVAKEARGFLQSLYDSVAKYYEQGLGPTEMKSAVEQDLVAYKNWSGFESLGRVISFVYLKVEQEMF